MKSYRLFNTASRPVRRLVGEKVASSDLDVDGVPVVKKVISAKITNAPVQNAPVVLLFADSKNAPITQNNNETICEENKGPHV